MKSKIELMVGKRGTGKTTLIKSFLKKRARAGSRVVALDFLGEYQDYDSVLYSGAVSVAKAIDLVWSGGCREKRFFVIDELDMYSAKDVRLLKNVFRLSRHKNIDILASSHRLFSLDVVLRALVDDFYLFKISELRDLEYITSVWGRDIAGQVSALKRFEFIHIEA